MSLDRRLTATGIVAAASVVTFLYNRYQAAPATKNGIPLPPGPPACWFWETAFPRSNIAQTLEDWVARYGPVISLREGSRVVIVIGRLDAATEIMEKEGGALADRPRSVALGEMVSNNMRILTMASGERFRRFRKAVHTHLQPRAAEAYEGLQCEHAMDVVLDIMRDPKHHIEHVRRFSAAVILQVVRIQQNIKNLRTASRPGAYLVDIFPILKYVPGYGRVLRKYHEFELSLYRDQLARVKDAVSKNEASPSFSKKLLENTSDHCLSYDEMAYLAGTQFSAGSDTTSIAITTVIMAAARHPAAQACVQEELDTVVGTGRAPTFMDSNELPQLHAFISESLRWRPVMPIGFLHRATKDIVWRGQIIPAGATVLGCHWAISRDPVAFPNPDKFDPQRWLDTNGQLRTDLRFYTYGFGRRVCPGLHVANRSIYINVALLLWSFHIAERADAPIDVDSLTETIFSCSASLEVEFIPRMEEERLRETMEDNTELVTTGAPVPHTASPTLQMPQ
ncbi:cytochrome P450 [Melanogaster broomeanus]|nr:cytochrome P450 [Melanogaster broomeanus]